jgi:hypothetical protein
MAMLTTVTNAPAATLKTRERVERLSKIKKLLIAWPFKRQKNNFTLLKGTPYHPLEGRKLDTFRRARKKAG